MQETYNQCGLNGTSKVDRWMVGEDSPVFVGTKKLGTLQDISSDWTARIILANAIYFNAVNVLDDDEADDVVLQTFMHGGDAGQLAIATAYEWVYEQIEADKVPSQIASRIALYMYAINWTVTVPHASFEVRVFEPLKPEDCIIGLTQFDDGDYGLRLGEITSDRETIASMNMEVSRLIVTGYADVDHMYFSEKENLLACAGVAQKYLKEKWGYDFSVKDET